MIAAMFALGLAATPAAASGPWSHYVNVRFGFDICYPSALLHPQPEADNGDGRAFTGAAGVELRAYGINDVDGKAIAAAARTEAGNLGREGFKVTYQAVRADWYALSASNEREIVYLRRWHMRDQYGGFELRYPAAQAALEPGDGADQRLFQAVTASVLTVVRKAASVTCG